MPASLKKLFAPVLAGVLLLFPVLASAQLQSEGVVYVYMSMRVGEQQQPVLIPIASEQVRPDLPPAATIPAAFGVLRNGKPATYGTASVVASDALLAQRRVEVHLDPGADLSTFQIVSAEAVLTFAALGIERVVFPGWAPQGLTRADISFARYRFEMPMWQALVGGRVPEGDVILPSGEKIENAEFYRRLESHDRNLMAAILEVVRSGDRLPRYYVTSILGTLNVSDFEDAVIPMTQDDEAAFRALALRTLSRSSKPQAWDAIAAMLRDADPDLRSEAALALAEAPIESYRVYAVFFRAESPDTAVRSEAIRQMGTMNDGRVIEALSGWLRSPDATLRNDAMLALVAQSAWNVLVVAMEDEAVPVDTRTRLASTLADHANGDARRAGLLQRAFEARDTAAIADLDILLGMDAARVPATLEAFLAHPDASVIRHTLDVIKERRIESLLPALATLSQSDSADVLTRQEALDAIDAILEGMNAAGLQAQIRSSNPTLVARAYRALGAAAAAGRAPSDSFQTLRQGLSSSDPNVRGACALGVGAFGSAEALELVLRLEDDRDESVRGAAARALGSFTNASFAERVTEAVIRAIESGEPLVVAGGLDALGSLGLRALSGLASDKIRAPEAPVRASAYRAMSQLVDAENPQPAINAIGAGLRDQEPANRILAARLLGQFNHSFAVLTLSQAVNGPNLELRLAAIEAIGATRNDEGVGTLLSLLEDPERLIRLSAINGLRQLNLRQALPGIEAQMARERDEPTLSALLELQTALASSGQ